MSPNNKENFEITLTAFRKKFAALLIDQSSIIGEDEARAFVTQYTSVLNDKTVILESVQSIKKYINFYNVNPQNDVYDEFKLIYFTSKSITNKLDKLGYSKISKIHQEAALSLLDFRLQSPYGANRPQLTSRIVSAINHNKIQDHFGEYGLYILYKCLHNAAKDRAEGKGDVAPSNNNWT